MLIKIVFSALTLIAFAIGAGLFNMCMNMYSYGSAWEHFLNGVITTILILIPVLSPVILVICIVCIWR